MTGVEAVASLKELLGTALYYARQSQAGKNSDPLHDSSTALWIRQFNELSFDSPGLGFQVSNGQASWKDWAEKFSKDVSDLLAYRETFGFDGHGVKVVDSGVIVDPKFILIGHLTDDPMCGWWYDVAAPKLDSMATSDAIQWVTEPLKEGAAAVAGILDYASPLVIVVIVILVLILAIKLT